MRIIILIACLWLATSPLHGKIVFYSARDGNHEIYKMNSDGSNQTRLTFNEASDTYPVWSPDGRQIAFTSQRDGNEEVYVMSANGRNQRNLTRHPGYDAFPDWHPDGKLLAFESDRHGGNNHDICVMDTGGNNVQQITDLFFPVASKPKWSPEGTRIAFEAGTDKVRQVHIINADGSRRWQVTDAGGQNKAILHGWSPDGQHILYTLAVDGRFDDATLMVVELSPNKPGWKQQVFGELAISLFVPVTGSAFSPDGTSILYVAQTEGHWNIYRLPHPKGNKQQLTDDIHDNFAPHESPHEWNAILSVSSQELTPMLWGEIKVTK